MANAIGVGFSLRTASVKAAFVGVFTEKALPSILLQSVVECDSKHKDGDPIIAVLPAWKEIAKFIERNPEDIFKIDPRRWEEIIAGAYSAAGFDDVILTPRSGDLGRDIIAVKRGMWSVRILDQVKAFGPKHAVTANDVRAMYGVLHKDQNASKAVVTTTSFFAPGIEKEFADVMPHRLELVNGDELVKRLSRIAESA